MNVKIVKTFRDKDNFSIIYAEGTTISVSPERGKYIVALGLAEEIPEEETETTEPTEPEVTDTPAEEIPEEETEVKKPRGRKSKNSDTENTL
jgi:hypothetical protein